MSHSHVFVVTHIVSVSHLWCSEWCYRPASLSASEVDSRSDVQGSQINEWRMWGIRCSCGNCFTLVNFVKYTILTGVRTFGEATLFLTQFLFFSSPEHKVLSELLWSFNVRPPSSVVRASVRACVRQQFL